MHRPLVSLCIVLCLGIIFAIWTKVNLAVLFLLSFLSLAAGAVFRKQKFRPEVFLYLSYFFIGAVLLRNSQNLPNCHLAKNLPAASVVVSLRGIVANDPLITRQKSTFVFSAKEIILSDQRQRVCGKVLVRAYGDYPFRYGQELILTGTIYRPYNFLLSKRLNYRDFLKRKGIYDILSVKKGNGITEVGINRGNPLLLWSIWIKQKMEATIDGSLSPLSAGILNAMVLGERRAVPRAVNDAMVKSGTVHILVVSGFNVGVVAFIVFIFLKVLRIPRRIRLWFTMALLVFYCLLTGASTPVIRATVMGLVIILGYLLERESNLYNSLSLAAIIILAFNPWQILDVGFQLSFISVLSIAWLYPKIQTLLPASLFRIAYLRAVLQALAVSSAAWLGTAGLIAYYFGLIAPVTVLANLLILPLTSFITACGFALVIIGKLLPPLAGWFAGSCELAILALLKINIFLINLKGAYFYINPFAVYYVIAYYGLILGLFAGLNALRGKGATLEVFDKPRQV